MSEVDKLYSLARVEAKEFCDRDSDLCMSCCPEWNNRKSCWKYKSIIPPFTAEKQLELIKWMVKTNHRYFIQDIIADDFSETLAGVFNLYWLCLTEADKAQIKEILE